ncbi:MAG: isoleucine--tRNA ligase [Candidatus Bathyarchaeia archaeon]
MEYTVGGLPLKRYDPKAFEDDTLRWWFEEGVYERARSRSGVKGRFYFLDGPPYVTASIHVGTAWNKIMKDVVLRYRRMRGYDVRDQPGFDMHGLPIEVMVERLLGLKSKKDIEVIGVDRFVDECRRYALEHMKILTEQFKNLGVWMDWGEPYMTISDEFIEAVWWLIKRADERRLLEEGLRVTHWCPRCETALAAGYEVSQEYREVEDPSIYVKLPVEGSGDEYIIVWTTTPWTLPANVAVMVHPDENYVKVRVDGGIYILAEARCKPVLEEELKLGYEVLEVFPGSRLEGLRYKPPLLEEVDIQRDVKDAHIVILSREYVSMDEGTGCVHTAPGHGEEDFEVGLRYRLPVLCPVDSRGVFDDTAGRYAGLTVWDANQVIVEDLRRKGLLLYASTVKHRYPHCWRCRSKLILRATRQWVLKVTAVKDRLLEENGGILWVPSWAGESRFRSWLEGVRDWVISRQRYWGIPLPIWVCGRCGRRIIIGSKDELRSKALNPEGIVDLHRPWIDRVEVGCDSCGGVMRRVEDVADVWMDSGVASWACLGYPRRSDEFKRWWPADFILEGHDQTRGWFYSQLASSIIAFDSKPYKAVLMHGFTLDETGREMHKSWGNFVAPEDVIDRYGRDTLRFYELQFTPWEDLRFSWRGVEEAYRTLNLVWNLYLFASLYMNLDRFQPSRYRLEELRDKLRPEDRWILSKTQRVVVKATEALESYLIHEALRAVRELLVEDVSRWYAKLIRRRVWMEEESIDKVTAYATLYRVLDTCLRILAVYTPFLAEKIYQDMFRYAEPGRSESIHMEGWPEADTSWIDDDLEDCMEVCRSIMEEGLSLRNRIGVKLRQPLASCLIYTEDPGTVRAVEVFRDVLASGLNVKDVRVIGLDELRGIAKLRVRGVPKMLGPRFRERTKIVMEALDGVDGADARRMLESIGVIKLYLGDSEIEVKAGEVEFYEEISEGWVVGDFKGGRILLSRIVDRRLAAEGLARDLIRRIQYMRKEMDLPVEDYVEVTVSVPSVEALEMVEEYRGFIASETRAKLFEAVVAGRIEYGYVREWDIDGENYTIAVKHIGKG